jgi:hypothetical protein
VKKLSFDEAMERIGDERSIDRDEVQTRALQRYIWIAEWHFPGCLSESRSYCLTKADAIESALDFASGENGPPHGMLSDLRRYGNSDRTAPDAWARGAITTIERVQLRDIL